MKLSNEEKYIIVALIRFGASMKETKADIGLDIARLLSLRINNSILHAARPFIMINDIDFFMKNIDDIDIQNTDLKD